MVSTTFKEMYPGGDYSKVSDTWNEKKVHLSKNIRLYYVYDIITNYWSEGGTGKIHSAAKPNRYMNDISPRAWGTALDGFFERSMLRLEAKQIANPRSEEYVLLNCIYLNTFTAMDQLSIDKFDVEHIAPKEQLKRLISSCGGAGLPISCVANLCYLPEYVNRSKRDKNFYQDTKYLQHINLDEVERKYSFTTSDDLEWMDMSYEGQQDFDALKQFYTDYCVSRFATMKRLFCSSMGINYDELTAVAEEAKPIDTPQVVAHASPTTAFTSECVDRVSNSIGQPLTKIGRSIYKSQDGKSGFVFCVSKAYKQGNREKYWFGYRRNPLEEIVDCEKQYIVYGCKDAGEVLLMPVSAIEAITGKINASVDENGDISHWHIVFFRDAHGYMTQLLSKPELTEVDITEYKLSK